MAHPDDAEYYIYNIYYIYKSVHHKKIGVHSLNFDEILRSFKIILKYLQGCSWAKSMTRVNKFFGRLRIVQSFYEESRKILTNKPCDQILVN